MRRFSLSMLALCGLLLSGFVSPQVFAQESVEVPVGAIPVNAGLVVRIADPDQGIKKLTEMVSAVDPSQGPSVGALGFFSGAILDNPAKAGVKKETDWWFAAIVRKGEEPALIVAVQPSDLDAMKDAIGDKYEYIEYANWVLYTKDAEAAEQIRKCVAKEAKNIESAGDDGTKELFMASDVAVFINFKELTKTFAEEIERARGEVHRGLNEAGNFAMPVEGLNMQAILDMYADGFDAILDGLSDMNSLSVGLNVSKEGLTLREHLDVIDGSKTDEILKQHKPGSLKSLAQLPVGQHSYFGLHCDMNELTKWSMGLMKKMFELDAEKAAKLDNIVEMMQQKDYEIGDYVGALSVGDLKGGIMRSFVLSQVKNAASYSKLYAESFEVFGDLGSNEFVQQEMIFTPKAETIEGKQVDHLLIKQNFESDVVPGEIANEIMTAIYGPEGSLTRILYEKDAVLQTSGGGAANMKKLLASVADPHASPAFEKTRQALLPEANLIVMFDPASTVAQLGKAVLESGRIPVPQMKNPAYDEEEAGSKEYVPLVTVEQIDNLKLVPSYAGTSIATGNGEVNVKSHFPVEQMKNIYKLVMFGMNTYQSFNSSARGAEF